MRLSDTGIADEDDIVLGVEKGQVKKVLYLLAINFLGVSPSILVERLDKWEVAVSDAALNHSFVSMLSRGIDQFVNESQMRQILGCCL